MDLFPIKVDLSGRPSLVTIIAVALSGFVLNLVMYFLLAFAVSLGWHLGG